VSIIVLHTTEGGTLESNAAYLQATGRESHYVYDGWRDESIQLLPLDRHAKALLNVAGGVETNRRGSVYQIELVGSAADVPGYDDAWYRNVARFVAQVPPNGRKELLFKWELQAAAKVAGV